MISTLILALLPIVQAQTVSEGAMPALNSQVFRPTIDALEFLGTDDSFVKDGRFSARGLLQYAYQPLIYTAPNGEVTGLVSNLVQLDAMAGYGLGPVRVGLDLPVYLFANGDAGGQAGLGDLALDVKYRLLKRSQAPVGLALSGRAALPTNTTSAALGSDGLLGDLVLIGDKELGDWVLAGNLGARLQPAVELENTTWGSQALFRLGASRALSTSTGLSLELGGQSSFQAGSTPVEALVGGWHRLSGSALVARGGLGTGLTESIGSPRLRMLFALGWEPKPIHDRDKDGIADRKDSCPDQPEDKDEWEDTDGCPEPTRVRILVKSPSGKAVNNASVILDGKPLSPGQELSLEPGKWSVQASAPEFSPADLKISVPAGPPVEREVLLHPFGRLTIRVLDQEGKPLEAEILVQRAGAEPLRATATTLDKSMPAGALKLEVRREGFAPYVEPATIEEDKTRLVEIRLAPAKATIDAAKTRIDIRDSIYFDLDQATIKPESVPMLKEVAQLVLDHPELLKIRIEGHTDSQGEAQHNLELSKARAAALRQFLIERGVAPERLESEGFGESKPLVKGENEAAWSKNRRVDFFVKERKD